MFNFRLQQKAFDELNAEQFRMVYFLNSTLSMVNKKNSTPSNTSIEMYNGYMMDKLGLSERQIQRLIKSLEVCGFISVKRATARKQPNIITFNCDIKCDMKCDKNVTLNNMEINNNNDNNDTNGTKDISQDSTICTMSVEGISQESFFKNTFENEDMEEITYESETSLPYDEIYSNCDFSVFRELNQESAISIMENANSGMNEMSDKGTNVMNDSITSNVNNISNMTPPLPRVRHSSTEFNRMHDQHRHDLFNAKSIEEMDAANAALLADWEWVKNSSKWKQTQIEKFFDAYTVWQTKSEKKIGKLYKQLWNKEHKTMYN